jgi:hypothetical protein
MGEARSLDRSQMMVRIGISLGQGALLWWLYDRVEHDLWPKDQMGWLVALVAAAVLVPGAHYLIADLPQPRRQLQVLAGLALLALGLGWHHGAWGADEPYDAPIAFAVPLAVLVFHALPFVQAVLTRGFVRPRYEDLFQFAWRNALLIALGCVFAGVFWLLLALWGVLFQMLGVEFFRKLFTSSPFAIPATTVAVGVGVQLAGSVERLQSALRQQLLALLKWLTPLATLILVLFTVTLVAKSPELFAEQRRAISAVWLLWLVAVTVALLNSAYQDGREDTPYPRWLGNVIRVAAVLLLPVALLAVYALAIRLDRYGITVPRAWGLLVALIALIYAGGYAWASVRKGPWMGGIGAVNVAVALFTIAMLTIMLTPALSPERLSAASQYRRALAESTDDAYVYLRFQSGRYGRERLKQLAAIEGAPNAEDIRARAGRQLQRKERWEGSGASERLVAERSRTSRRIPPRSGSCCPLCEHRRKGPSGRVRPADRCPVLFADLNRDGSDEAILFTEHWVVAATRRAGRLEAAPLPHAAGGTDPEQDQLAIRDALKERPIPRCRTAVAGYRDQRRNLRGDRSMTTFRHAIPVSTLIALAASGPRACQPRPRTLRSRTPAPSSSSMR